jgi:hypothetical protein
MARAERWVSSSKNIIGSILAIVVILGQLLIGFGPLWPAFVIGAYVVGALLAPRDRVQLMFLIASGVSATAADLSTQLKSLRRTAAADGNRLGDGAAVVLNRTLDTLDEIVGRWDVVAASPEHSHTVERIVFEYLPTALQGYLNLPRTFAISARTEGKKSAREELLDQLGVLDKETDRIRTAAYARDLDNLSAQTQFLHDKFTPSTLDLP